MNRTAILLLALLPWGAFAQDGMPIETWMKAKEIRYRIEGIYNARRSVAYGDPRATAYITDRVVMELDWDQRHSQFLKLRRIDNFPAKATETESDDPKCASPAVNGIFDVDLVNVTAGYAGDLMLTTQTSWPLVEVSEACNGGTRKLLAARKNSGSFTLPMVSPVMLSLPANGFTVAEDRKSFSYTQADWYWTYTPLGPVTEK